MIQRLVKQFSKCRIQCGSFRIKLTIRMERTLLIRLPEVLKGSSDTRLCVLHLNYTHYIYVTQSYVFAVYENTNNTEQPYTEWLKNPLKWSYANSFLHSPSPLPFTVCLSYDMPNAPRTANPAMSQNNCGYWIWVVLCSACYNEPQLTDCIFNFKVCHPFAVVCQVGHVSWFIFSNTLHSGAGIRTGQRHGQSQSQLLFF